MSADGGRFADWRLADFMPSTLLEDTHKWRLRWGLEWAGQLLDRGLYVIPRCPICTAVIRRLL